MPLTLTGPNVIYQNSTVRYSLYGCVDDTVAAGFRLHSASLTGSSAINLLGPHGVAPFAGSSGPWYTLVAAPCQIEVVMGNPSPGQQTLTLNFVSVVSGGADGTVTQTIAVPVSVIPSAAAPCRKPIPNLATWKSMMQTLSDKWAPDQLNGTWTLNLNYDLGQVFWQVGDYLNTDKYFPAALAAAQFYRDQVVANNGVITAWSVWPKTLVEAYKRTNGDVSYLNALKLLLNGPWVSCGGDPCLTNGPGVTTFRETGLALGVFNQLVKIGQAPDPRWQVCANNMLGQFTQTYIQQDRSAPNQPFWFGLAAEQLIDYYKLTGDARVIEQIKVGCDFIWSNGVDPSTGKTLYDIWQPQGQPALQLQASYCGLNLMFAYAWAFLYKETGDERYRDQGDILFQHFNDDDGGGITFSSKMFGENYRTSILYVEARG